MFVYYFAHIPQPFAQLADRFANHPELWVPRYAGEACKEAESVAGGASGAHATGVSVGPVSRTGGSSSFAFRVDDGAFGDLFTHLEADLEIAELGDAQTQLTLRGSYRAPNRLGDDAQPGLRHRRVEAIAKSIVERVARRLARASPTSPD